MARGGAREGAGRKRKADELAMIEKMDAVMAPEIVWEKLSEMVANDDANAVKLWLAYRFGQPKQIIDANHSGSIESYKPSWYIPGAIMIPEDQQKES